MKQPNILDILDLALGRPLDLSRVHPQASAGAKYKGLLGPLARVQQEKAVTFCPWGAHLSLCSFQNSSVDVWDLLIRSLVV